MRSRFRILKGTRIPAPGGGGTTEYTEILSGWGKKINTSTSRVLADSQSLLMDIFAVRIRFVKGLTLTTDMLMEIDGKRHNIAGVTNLQERSYYWDIICSTNGS